MNFGQQIALLFLEKQYMLRKKIHLHKNYKEGKNTPRLHHLKEKTC